MPDSSHIWLGSVNLEADFVAIIHVCNGLTVILVHHVHGITIAKFFENVLCIHHLVYCFGFWMQS